MERPGGHFGCSSNGSVFTIGGCGGLFRCGNGYVTMCGKSDTKGRTDCECKEPCHKSIYQDDLGPGHGHCPPAMPLPLLPPLPPVPPLSPPPLPPPLNAPPRKSWLQTLFGSTPSAPGLPPSPRSSPNDGQQITATVKLALGESARSGTHQIATCEHWCKRNITQHSHYCKCASCAWSPSEELEEATEVQHRRTPLGEGAPCHNGHAPHAAEAPSNPP
jgi:hypothetical protein